MAVMLKFYVRLLRDPWNVLVVHDFITLLIPSQLLALMQLTHRWDLWKVYNKTAFLKKSLGQKKKDAVEL
jgi:hypothetical protein